MATSSKYSNQVVSNNISNSTTVVSEMPSIDTDEDDEKSLPEDYEEEEHRTYIIVVNDDGSLSIDRNATVDNLEEERVFSVTLPVNQLEDKEQPLSLPLAPGSRPKNITSSSSNPEIDNNFGDMTVFSQKPHEGIIDLTGQPAALLTRPIFVNPNISLSQSQKVIFSGAGSNEGMLTMTNGNDALQAPTTSSVNLYNEIAKELEMFEMDSTADIIEIPILPSSDASTSQSLDHSYSALSNVSSQNIADIEQAPTSVYSTDLSSVESLSDASPSPSTPKSRGRGRPFGTTRIRKVSEASSDLNNQNNANARRSQRQQDRFEKLEVERIKAENQQMLQREKEIMKETATVTKTSTALTSPSKQFPIQAVTTSKPPVLTQQPAALKPFQFPTPATGPTASQLVKATKITIPISNISVKVDQPALKPLQFSSSVVTPTGSKINEKSPATHVSEVEPEKIEEGRKSYSKRINRRPSHLADPNFILFDDIGNDLLEAEVVEPTKTTKDKEAIVETNTHEAQDYLQGEEIIEYDDPNKLWCTCRKPHNNRFMICCDKCQEWFHGHCVGVTKKQGHELEKRNKQWHCRKCVRIMRAEKILQQQKADIRRRTSRPESSRRLSQKQDSVASPQKVLQKRVGSTEESIDCIVCGNPSRQDSAYCSDKCVQKYAEVVEKNSRTLSNSTPTSTTTKKSSETSPTAPSDSNDPRSTNPQKLKKSLSSQKDQVTHPFLTFHVISANANVSTEVVPVITPPSKNVQRQLSKTPTPLTGSSANLVSPTAMVSESNDDPKNNTSSSAGGSRTRNESRNKTSPTNNSKSIVKSSKKLSMGGPSSEKLFKDNIKKVLSEVFKNRLEEMTSAEKARMEKVGNSPEVAAVKILDELINVFGSATHQKCKNKYRSIFFNLKDTKNFLFREILMGTIKPSSLVMMESHEMAPAELTEWRQKESQKELEAIQRAELDKIAQARKDELIERGHDDALTKAEEIRPKDITEVLVTEEEEEHRHHHKDKERRHSGKSSDKSKHHDKDRSRHRHHSSSSNHHSSSSSRRSDKDRKHSGSSSRDSGRDKEERSSSKHRERDREKSSSRDKDSRREKDKDKERRRDKDKEKERNDKDKSSRKHDEEKKLSTTDSKDSSQAKEGLSMTVEKKDEEAEKIDDVEMTDETPQVSSQVYNSTDSEQELPSSTITTPDSSFTVSHPDSDLKPILKTTIAMPEIGSFSASIYEVSHTGMKGIFFPPDSPVQIVGRIAPETVWDYINKMKMTKEVVVLRLVPATLADEESYMKFFNYFSSRCRLAVLGGLCKPLKDVYLIPLDKYSPIDPSLLPFHGPGLPENRSHCFISVVTRHHIPTMQINLRRRLSNTPTTEIIDRKKPKISLNTSSSLPLPILQQEMQTPISSEVVLASASSSKLTAVVDDDDEPYTPWGEDEQDELLSTTTAELAGATDAEKILEELDEKIKARKQEIESMSVAISSKQVESTIPGLDEYI